MPLHSWLPAGARLGAQPRLGGDVRRAAQDGHLRAAAHDRCCRRGRSRGARRCSSSAPLSASLAIAFAIGQCDLKRLLAYSSIENIGHHPLGLGLALVGRSTGRADWMVLGMAGCLFHVWNHGLFKSLLFFGAGAVVHAASRDHRPDGRARAPHAGDRRALPGRRGGDLRPAAVQRLRQRAAGLPRAGARGGHSGRPPGRRCRRRCWRRPARSPWPVSSRSSESSSSASRGPAAAGAAHEPPARMLAPMAVLAGGCLLLGVAPGDSSPRCWIG